VHATWSKQTFVTQQPRLATSCSRVYDPVWEYEAECVGRLVGLEYWALFLGAFLRFACGADSTVDRGRLFLDYVYEPFHVCVQGGYCGDARRRHLLCMDPSLGKGRAVFFIQFSANLQFELYIAPKSRFAEYIKQIRVCRAFHA
jgi:hypothetical protein